jgi:hypothetical protein
VCPSKKSKRTARCSSNSTLARSLPSKKPRKPCKRDLTPRAQRIVSPLCVRQSEPSEADSLHTSDITLSSLPMDWKVQHTCQKAKEAIDQSVGRTTHLKSQLLLSHNNQPLIAAPEFRNIHINHDDTTRVLLPNIHPSFSLPLHLPCIQTTHHLDLSASSVEYRLAAIPAEASERVECRSIVSSLHLFSSSPHARAPKLRNYHATATQ